MLTFPTSTDQTVFLDAEFVEGDELIELSIYALDRNQVYHSLFKPARYTSWDSSVHHITPDMVADASLFADELPRIQAIIDRASHIGGFAVENDISHLRNQGVHGLDRKSIIELRNWFWINHGRHNGLDLFQGVSLASVASSLGVDFGSDGIHSASGDTLATLDAFLILLDRFKSSCGLEEADFDSVIGAFNELYTRERLEYDRIHAEGYAALLRIGEGYALKVKREEPHLGGKVIAVIHVADRQRASVELHNIMARRPMISKGVYRLTEADIKRFRDYSNGFDINDHAYFKKLQALSSKFNISGLKR